MYRYMILGRLSIFLQSQSFFLLLFARSFFFLLAWHGWRGAERPCVCSVIDEWNRNADWELARSLVFTRLTRKAHAPKKKNWKLARSLFDRRRARREKKNSGCQTVCLSALETEVAHPAGFCILSVDGRTLLPSSLLPSSFSLSSRASTRKTGERTRLDTTVQTHRQTDTNTRQTPTDGPPNSNSPQPLTWLLTPAQPPGRLETFTSTGSPSLPIKKGPEARPQEENQSPLARSFCQSQSFKSPLLLISSSPYLLFLNKNGSHQPWVHPFIGRWTGSPLPPGH